MWALTVAISGILVLLALGMWIAGDYNMKGSNKAAHFSASYTLLFIVSLSVGGTFVLNKVCSFLTFFCMIGIQFPLSLTHSYFPSARDSCARQCQSDSS
jgi:hypothetical protein